MKLHKTEIEQAAERLSPRPKLDPEYAGVLGMAAAGTAISLFPLPDSYSIMVSIFIVTLAGAVPYLWHARQRDRYFLTLARLTSGADKSGSGKIA